MSVHANKHDRYLKNLNAHQMSVLYKTFYRGKADDLSWTLTAIAWKESDFGLNLVGRTTPDYGVFQININTYMNRFKLKKTDKIKAVTVRALRDHYDTGFTAAVAELTYWRTVYKDNWRKIWAGYNSGWKGGEGYAESIAVRIAALKRSSLLLR